MPADARDVEFVEINGEISRLIRQTVVKTFKTTEFTELLRRSGGINTGLMPFNCIYFKEGRYERGTSMGQPGTHYRLHVIALKPRVWTVRFKGVDTGESPDQEVCRTVRTFGLALPWVFVFVLYQNNGLAQVLLYGSSEIDGLVNYGLGLGLCLVPLPNIGMGGSFCLGELRLDSTASFHNKTNRIIQYIDESVWNNDLWPQYGHPGKSNSVPNVYGIGHWAEMTAQNGQGFWQQLKMRPAGVSLDHMIKRLTQ